MLKTVLSIFYSMGMLGEKKRNPREIRSKDMFEFD